MLDAQCLETIVPHICLLLFQVDSGRKVNPIPVTQKQKLGTFTLIIGTHLVESVDLFFPSFAFASPFCKPGMVTVTQDRLDLVIVRQHYSP